jgi:hypothetical protein
MGKDNPASNEKVGLYPTQFFEAIFDGYILKRGLVLELRCIHRDSERHVVRRFYKSLGKFKRAWKEICKLNRTGYDIYFGVAPRNPNNDDKLLQPPLLTSFWVDIDVGPDKPNKDLTQAQRRVRASHIKPTIVVNSGHGLHLYFRLKKPHSIQASKAKTLLRGIADALGGDLQSAEVARLLRVPNTVNWKHKNHPQLCQVLKLRNKRRFRLTKLKKLFCGSRDKGREAQTPQENGTSEDFFKFYSRYVEDLRLRRDHQAMGLCPFHPDQRPSFSLRISDGVWHCFGCGRSGNALSFCLMRGIDESRCPKATRLQEHNALGVEDGGYVIWKPRRSGWEKRRISNFVLEWSEENRVTDKVQLEDRIFDGTLVMASGKPAPLRLSNEDVCTNAQLYQALVREGGGRIAVSEHDMGNIRRASFIFSHPRELKTSMEFGFQDDRTFLAKNLLITPEEITFAEHGQIDLSHVEHACHLNLKKPDPSTMKYLLRHLRDDLLQLHPTDVTYTLFGFLGAAPLMSFMEDVTRYALWLVGQSGSGKSFLAKMFQCFFGDFAGEGRAVSWASTPNSLQYMGYFFKDCLYLVDDYKPVMIRSSAEVVRFLQNYADFYARSRLTSEIQSRKDYYVRGSLLTTGEDMPTGHASLIARSLILKVPKRELDTRRGDRCLKNCKDYPMITASYIRFLLHRPQLRQKVNAKVHKFHELFLAGIPREDNAVRIARNLALNSVGFRYFIGFLEEADAGFDTDQMLRVHAENLLQLRQRMLNLIRKENPAEIFLQVLTEAIAAGRARIRSGDLSGSERGAPIIGFWRDSDSDECVCILPHEATGLVREQEKRSGRDFDWSPQAIAKQLYAHGALVRSQARKDFGTTVRLGVKTYRVWRIKCSFLGWGKEDGEDVT